MQQLDEDELRRRLARLTKAEMIEELLAHQLRGVAPLVQPASERDIFFNEAAYEGLLLHRNFRIEDANPAALRMLAITYEGLIGKQVQEFLTSGWPGDATMGSPSQVTESIWTRDDGTSFVCESQNQALDNGRQLLHIREVAAQRRPAAERVRLAEEMWDLYNNTPCGYHTIDERGIVVRMNATELDWLGYDYSEMIGQIPFERLLTARGLESYRKLWPELLTRKWAQNWELEFERKDGSAIPTLVSATVVSNQLGQLVQCRFTVFDITELRRATKEMRESEEKFRAIAEQSLIGIFIVQDGRLIYGNESMRRITGYNPQDLLDLGEDGFLRLFHPDDRNFANRTFRNLMLHGDKLAPRDIRGLHKNGETLWLQLSASQVILRNTPSFFGMIADVSERKRAEEERQAALSRAVRHQVAISQMATCAGLVEGDLMASLKVITEQTANALGATRASVWLLDKRENVLQCKILYERETAQHSQPELELGPEDIPHYFQALSSGRVMTGTELDPDHVPAQRLGRLEEESSLLDAAVRHSGKLVGALCLEHGGFHRIWTQDEISFASEAADQVGLAMYSHRRRITETQLLRAKEKVRALNDRLKQRVQERTVQLHEALNQNAHRAGMAEIATAVLHNVGNILTSVITSGQTIEKTVQTSSLRSLRRANKLLDTLLDQSTERAVQLREFYHTLDDLLNKEHSEINENVDQVLKKIDLIRDVITAQQSFASTESQAEPLFLPDVVEEALNIQEHTLGRHDVTVQRNYMETPHIKASKIKLIHILINLVKNAREALDANQTDNRMITLFVGQEAGRAVIKVRDNGIGIAPEALEKVFSHGFSTKKGGHGFGLHSSQLAIEEMGGSIRVESEGLGQGATFVLSFPIPEQELVLDT